MLIFWTPVRLLVAVVLSWCVWSLLLVVPASCLLLFPRSCSWWLVSMTATPQPEAARPPWATLVRSFLWIHQCLTLCMFSLLWSAAPHLWCIWHFTGGKERVCKCTTEVCTLVFLFPLCARHATYKHWARLIAELTALLMIPLFSRFAAKATFDAISKTYSYLTPDLWKETVFTKSPYQVIYLSYC